MINLKKLDGCELRRQSPAKRVVSGAQDKDLLPWEKMLTLDHRGFLGLTFDWNRKIPIVSRLGGIRLASEVHMFYAQAGTVCLYLLTAENGKRKESLMRYVGAYYSGKTPKIEEYFGMSAEELGKRARQFAKDFTAWR